MGQQVNDSIPKGKLVIKADLRLDTVIQQRIEKNLASRTIPGFRIQIYVGDDKKKAMDIKTDFLSRYPDVPVYVKYQTPYFKVRVGDFLTVIMAQPLYNKLMEYMDNIFIVPDDVNMEEL
jgi:hypothetical protein